ncbi:Chloroplast envelope membrane protein [Linum grandiflorum]
MSKHSYAIIFSLILIRKIYPSPFSHSIDPLSKHHFISAFLPASASVQSHKSALPFACPCKEDVGWSSYYLMTTSLVFSQQFLLFNQSLGRKSGSSLSSSTFRCRRGYPGKKYCGFIPNCSKKHSKKRKSSWWQSFFFNDDGNWLGLKDDDMDDEDEELTEDSGEEETEELSEAEKFEAWKKRAEAIVELREAQEEMLNEESRRWEDWIVDEDVVSKSGDGFDNGGSWWTSPNLDGNGSFPSRDDEFDLGGDGLLPRSFVQSVEDIVLGREDDDMLYEDRVFRFASLNSAKYLAILIIIPWTLDFLVHDYVLMPFLDRYVKTVPLAAEMLDVRKEQKLVMVKDLKMEKTRLRLEIDMGVAPPLSDDQVWLELHHKALELRDEWRFENRKAFANIWSDMVFGISLFLLLYFNQNKVALLKFTGYKLLNNITDSGKAFTIILISDILLGYHSEYGWESLLEVIVEHYGLQIDPSAITIFVCIVPVTTDACVKLWMFKFLPRLSPQVTEIVNEMTRH